MSITVKLVHNATTGKLIDPPKEVKQLASRILSYRVEGAEFSSLFKTSSWDGRSSFYSAVKNTFPAGFAAALKDELQKAGHRVHFARAPLPAIRGVRSPIVDEHGNDDPRYSYQLETIDQLLRHGRGIAQIATGGGKSKIAKLAVGTIRRTTLFLTTRSVLMYQMADGFRDAGFGVGVLGDGEWTPSADTNVAMVQTLAARIEDRTLQQEVDAILQRRRNAEETQVTALKNDMKARKLPLRAQHAELDKLEKRLEAERPSDKAIAIEAQERFDNHHRLRNRAIKFLSAVELVIGEEAHEAGGDSYFRVLQACPNAHYRLALTATPFMRDDAEDNMRLMAAFGQKLIVVTEKQLIDLGILARPIFKYASLGAPPRLFKSTPYPRAVNLGIVGNEIRNRYIAFTALKAVKYGLPVLILVQRKAHGDALMKLFGKVPARYVQGADSQAKREKAIADLVAGRIRILIATNIFDVGVDMPAVGLVINAGGGKAEVGNRQRIGRGLRAKKVGPNIAFFLDFTDAANSHLKEHARARRAIVEQTPGFAENILPEGQDFPWDVFSENLAA